MVTPVFYARPQVGGRMLGVEPALASWDRAGSPGQARSAAFIDDVCMAVAGQARATPGPLALRLEVGLADTVPLYALNDLDNYLFPLIPKLTERTGRAFASVRATKQHAATSSVEVGPAVPADDPRGAHTFEVTTTASASATAYKEQIRDQIASASPLPGDGVALQLAFVVGPRRAWPNLWKATIDALGSILGHDDGAREWNARDGRIVDLGLHCAVDPAAGNEVTIAIRASTIGEEAAA
ncbi:hypothetical protein I6A84_01215 [Frankia sp. CNm7]|uniref:Uncharacterized protein n=1 Tax=Frankia nepalensis TaxID=1836974 RepID=A0A937RAZ3_9ACTN|nr:hypothetical protein [Frankia nepalensis]MBL7496123.1 hypothetical protein [Frankia nepalensis]MBL7508938.1 hypothetical protein [Frankia nepalensis]MBL7516778.1 hypothetical protein [Frankia nepalensis]MBL7628716.1 hypothetical protein [Frankia nepalensis]